MNQIKIFDTTLRDGEQSPGCSMNLKEKIEVAKCLERLKVDVIEAGFAISSPGDFESVKTIAETVRDCSVASLARATQKDIDCAWEAVKNAADPRIHVFLATSPLHMEYKLKMTPEQVLARTAEMVKYAKQYTSNIEFSCEDATRSDTDFLIQVVNAAVKNGATVINLPDTVGYTTPDEMRKLIKDVMAGVEILHVPYKGNAPAMQDAHGFPRGIDRFTAERVETGQQDGAGAVAGNQAWGEPGRNKIGDAKRDKAVPGLPRRHPQTALHGQRHTEHKPGPDAEKEHRNQNAKANAAKLQQARRDQRVGILTLLFARIQRRQPAQRNNGEKHNLQRPRPVPLGAERHREQQAAKHDRQQRGTRPVDA